MHQIFYLKIMKYMEYSGNRWMNKLFFSFKWRKWNNKTMEETMEMKVEIKI